MCCGILMEVGVGSAAPRESQPGDIQRTVDAFFATLPDYRAGDIISRSQIEKAIGAVEGAHGKVKGADAIVEKGLADNSFLIRELSSTTGKKFMRKVGRHVGAYARLDRLSSISGGQKVVRDLIRQPGGDELLTYMTTTKGGHKLGRQMAGVQRGADLNKPTGRIYTAEELIAEFERSEVKPQ
jgi:hypothetical protein